MDPNQITYFAETDARNKKIRFGIKSKDRTKHMYVIGKTGMGKSVLLENLAIQDIQNGEGLAFIDPHGGTAEKLLDYVPEHRIKDVLYFAPFDMEHPVSFNIIEDIGVDKRHLVVNGLMSTFEKIWVDAWSARMAYILNNTLLALLEYPGATLLGVNRVLADKDYRKKVVDNIKDPSVKSFWIEEFGKYTERYAAEATPAIQNKVGQFTSNPLVRNIIGQSNSTFDIRKIMDEKKILIINLSKGLVGEGNANLIGSMLITKIYLAAMSRADKSEQELAKLPNFYLYVDEFQSFANKSFADILSEARKYKLNLTIAHQYVEQMEEEVRDAVFGNAGTMISFRVGAFDAEVLEKEFAPTFTAEDLVNLGKYQVYLKLMIDGVASSPFSATTMAPIERPEMIFKKEVIASSREQFTRPRAIVEKEINDWHEEGTKKVEPKPNQNFSSNRDLPNTRYENNFKKPEVNKSFTEQRDQKVPEQKIEKMISDESGNISKPKLNHYGIPISNTPNNTKVDIVDQNKLAFIKAQEDLKKLQPIKNEQIKQSPEAVSLSSLKKDDKKIPSAQNISSLKEALSSVISKPKPDTISEKTEPVKKQLSENKDIPSPEKKEEKEDISNVSSKTNSREVPEDILRDILKMN